MSLFSSTNRTGAIISLLFVMLIWGSAATVTKVGIQDIPPYLFALLRNIIASVCILPLFLMRRKKLTKEELNIPRGKIFWMGLTGITLFAVTFNLGLSFTSAATGALIQGFIPVVIIIMAVMFLGERLTFLQVAGITISVGGVILIGFIGHDQATGSLKGNLLVIASVICWGAYTIIAKKVKGYDSIIVTAETTFVGTLLLFPFAIVENYKTGIPVISGGVWFSMIYLGLFSSTIGYILYNRVMKVLPAIQVGNFMNLDPVFGGLIALIFLQDRITGWQWIGTLFVLTGIFIASRSRSLKKAGENAAQANH